MNPFWKALIKTNGLKRTPAEHIKYLEMYFDKCLDWNHHKNDYQIELQLLFKCSNQVPKLRPEVGFEPMTSGLVLCRSPSYARS